MNSQFDELTKSLAQSFTGRAALKKFSLGLAGMALACYTLAFSSRAAGPTFTTIDYPGAVFTTAPGINRFGDIVGHYIDAAGIDHGYLLHKGIFSTVDFPGSSGGHVHDINFSGAIVGEYFIAKRYNGFLLSGGAYISIEFPNAQSTRANGINTAGDIVGSYYENNSDSTGGSNGSKGHGFLLSGGMFRTIDFPGADYTDVWRINDNGQILGRYKNGNGDFHIFLLTLSNGAFTSIDYPGGPARIPHPARPAFAPPSPPRIADRHQGRPTQFAIRPAAGLFVAMKVEGHRHIEGITAPPIRFQRLFWT